MIELRPGLYLVAETAESAPFDVEGGDAGFVPLIPLAITAARHAIDNAPGARRAPAAPAPAIAAPALPASVPLQLPGPVAPGWADPEVAEAFGCACAR